MGGSRASRPSVLTVGNHPVCLIAAPVLTTRGATKDLARKSRITSRDASRLARDAALEGGYKGATVTETNHNDDEDMYEVELEDESGRQISVSIDGASGKVVEMTTD
jgi:uncharacterized membrane protein YkoI